MISLREQTKYIGDALLSTVYPPICAGCGARGMWLCDMCASETPSLRLPTTCIRCGAPRIGGHCQCGELPSFVDQAIAPFSFDGWIREAVHRLKYSGETRRAGHLGGCMSVLLPSFGRVDALVPVPLHAQRMRTRGYNQAEALAVAAGAPFGVPVINLLDRTRNTVSQTTLDSAGRQANVHGGFSLRPGIRVPPGAHIVLIDDVMTTGATLFACAEALALVRPAFIGILTLARELFPSDRRIIREVNTLVRNGVPGPIALQSLSPSGPHP